MNIIKCISLILVIVGAMNWGLVGMFQFDLVSALFGEQSMVTRLIYSLVGVSGIFLILSSGFRTALNDLRS